MNLLDFFREYLLTRDTAPSKVTIKNYLADVRKFVLWVETTYHISFNPSGVTNGMIARYKEEKLSRIKRGSAQTMPVASASSVERYMSSLRKFFLCLKENGIISTSPFDLPNAGQPAQEIDKWNLKAFKNSLFTSKNSHLTIKNYIIDVRQFLEWAEQVTKAPQSSYIVDKRSVLEKIDAQLIEEYKNRLLHEGQLSPVSINRKLSSLRRYFTWAYQEKLLPNMPQVTSNIIDHQQNISEAIKSDPLEVAVPRQSLLKEETLPKIEDETNQSKSYSKIPPIRLGQKIARGVSLLFDAGFIIPAAFLSQQLQYAGWILTGKKVFSKQTKKALEGIPASVLSPLMADPLGKVLGTIPNFKKSFYAPYKISTEGMPLYRKVIHHARYTRPKWYKRYHSYPLVHYIHFAILVIFMSAVGFGLYRAYWLNPNQQNQALAAKASPPRVLSFQGRLTDSKDNPITANTNLRFAIYNSQTASGSAMLWQEIQNVTPDQDGIFEVLLGKNSPIPQSLFGENSALFLGISVNGDSELIPRQQIATVAYATNAELLQGMPAITDPTAGTTNVILALDSAGNLTIGGNASPTFQATGGTFTLSGKVLNLTTTTGSNGNVVINPDGTGIVDIQKPLQNTTETANTVPGVSGAVEVDDTLAILGSNGQPAIAINQTGTGPILTASQAGLTKFRVGPDGAGYLAQSLGIDELNPNSRLYVNSDTDPVVASFNSTATTTTFFNFLTDRAVFATLDKNEHADLELTTAGSDTDLIFSPGGNIGIGTTIPDSFKVQVDGDIGPNVDSAYDLGSRDNKFDALYVNDIFTADEGTLGFLERFDGAISPLNFSDDFLLGSDASDSATIVLSGTTGNIIANAITANGGVTIPTGQNLTLSGLTNAGGMLYTNGSGMVSQTDTGTNNQCLIGGSTPTWGSCATGTADVIWTNNAGAIVPLNLTSDLLVGATSTDSAKFAFINVGQGTPTASISGNITLNSAGVIQTTGNQPLTLGGDTTGDIILKGRNGASNGVTLSGYGTGLIQSNANGQLTSGALNLASGSAYVTGTLPITNGGTNTTALGSAGTIAYSNGTSYAFTGVGTSGQVLLSSGTGAPTWSDAHTAGVNYFQRTNGSIAPYATTDDLLLGGSATGSALVRFGGTPNADSFFNTGGNVGIGTTAPNGKFEVSEGIAMFGNSNGAAIEINSDPANIELYSIGDNESNYYANGGISFKTDANNNMGLGGANDGNAFSFLNGADNEYVTFDGDTEHVGIGTTGPMNTLDVNGAVAIGSYAGVNTAPSNSLIVSGNIGIGTTNPTANLEIAGTAKASGLISANGGLTIASGQSTTFGGFINNGGLLYTNGSGVVGQTGAGTATQCLLGGTTPTWGSCATGTTDQFWTLTGGALSTINSSQDLLLGGSSTTSAKFAVLNMANGTPVASVSSTTGTRNGISLGGDGTIQSLRNNTMTIGGNTTGAIQFAPNNSTMMTLTGGNVGIGTTNPGATLDLGSGTIQGAGLSSDCTGSSKALQWNSSSKQFTCGAQDQTVSAAKTSDTIKTNDTSLTNDPDFQFTVGANETWVFAFDNSWSVNSNTGMQEFITTPSGSICSVNYFDIQIDSGGGSGDGISDDVCSDITTITLANNHKYYERIYGVVRTGATGGTVALRWAQNTSGAGALTLYAGSSMVAYKKSGADVAEMYYTKDQSITSGTIVGMDSSIKAGVKKTEGAYSKDVMGIVTTNPGLVLSDGAPSGFPTNVALVGRVPVKVSSINGPIHAGDPIVPSDIPGVGMKATKAGEIVGKAMEDYDSPDPQAVGMIMAYVKETWYDPDVYITDTGNLSITASPSAGTYTVTNNNEIVDRIGAFKEAVIGKITAGILNVSQLSAENITVAGMSLRDYILSVVGQQDTTPNIISPIDGKLAVSVLSPLGDDPDVSLNLDKDSISVKNGKGQKVAGIDSQGNATFSGTLTADKLKTNNLDLSDEALAKLKDKLATNATQSAVNVTNITNIYNNASDSASNVSLTPTPVIASDSEVADARTGAISGIATSSSTPRNDTSGTTNSSDTTIQSDYANMASMSGVLGYVPNFSSDFATFTKGLMSFGPTSLSDTSVAGQFSVDGNMILADNSINVLGADLAIQPLRQGNVSFMGGLVKIDTEGNMSVAGNAIFAKNVTIKGMLATNVISPVPGEDLVIQLGGSKTSDGSDKSSTFVIADASGSAKFRVNNLGDLIASGSGTFKSLAAQALQIVRGAQADTSVTETVATSSAGTAVINKYQAERTVFSPYVKADSLIYITPTSDTGGLTPYIARQTAEDQDTNTKGSFTIQVPETTLKDIKVNWWIVN